MQTNISAVIITFNEERNIERCLQSLQGVADEIVVVDSFSTDRTETICAKYNAQFVKHPFDGYSEQKNFANSLIVNDYVLSIDADEALSDELKNAILKIKQAPMADAYCFNRLTFYAGTPIRHSGWYPDVCMRIWKKTIGEWQGAVHEKVVFNRKTQVEKLHGDLLHYTYYSIKEHLNASWKYADIAARDYLSKNKRFIVFRIFFSPLFKFIKTYFIKKGFLDGSLGLIIGVTSAYFTFLKYILVLYYRKQKK